MRRHVAWIFVFAALWVGNAVCWAQSPPVVTIDSYNRFCINGTPTFIIGTMGGDADDWQTFLKPAGFNVRFLGSTTIPGAHSVGLWELPDVFADPSAVATMRNDPGYLMWDLGYEIDLMVTYYLGWMPYTLDAMIQKRLECLANDPVNPRPVGACWGNAKRVYGSELWGWQGYWTGYRQYFPHMDYMVIGDYDWGLDEQTMSHAVRMSTKPVIYIVRSWPLADAPEGTRPEPQVVTRNIWMAAIVGVKGIIIDRYEMDAGGEMEKWTVHTLSHWWAIEKAVKELRQIENVLLTPGQWLYYKVENPRGIIYTYRKVGNDLYFLAVNSERYNAKSFQVSVPILEASAQGEVLFEPLTTGGINVNPTATTITDTTKNWTPNQLAGHRLHIRHGDPAHDHYYQIASNTSNTITIASGNLLTDGVARGNAYDVIQLITLSNRKFDLSLAGCGRKVIKFPNVTFSYQATKTAAAVGVPSNRRWKLLMDYGSQVGTEAEPEDAFGLAYDAHRHRLVALKGLANAWPQGKPHPEYADVFESNYVWEWDIDSGWYSGPIQEGEQQGGDPWPTDGNSYHEATYDPVRHCIISFNKDTRNIEEWRGPELGWRVFRPSSGDNEETPGEISHYAAAYNPTKQRWLLYGGKKWDFVSTSGYYREGQFNQEWFNRAHAYDGTYWYLHGNEANLPVTALQEPEMVWDTGRNVAVLFGLSHDGRWSTDVSPMRIFQDTPQQTYEINDSVGCSRKYTAHVPYVYYGYQMVFDPRTNTTLLFGGWPSVNGKGTDLYQYNGIDWVRLNYDHSAIAPQDARRIPTLVYDPDHQMVLFVDTRARKIWGLTSGLETQVSTIEQARALTNGTLVAIDGKVVSRRFNGYFYMQEPNGTTGIRVSSASTAASEGKVVNVIGTVATLPTGEKQIIAQVVGVAGDGEVRPIAMCNQDLGGVAAPGRPGVFGGTGPNNMGLLVTLFGKVTYVGSGFVYIDDGSGLSDGSGNVGVKVMLNGVEAPSLNEYVEVTGISGVESIAGHNARVILVAQPNDIVRF